MIVLLLALIAPDLHLELARLGSSLREPNRCSRVGAPVSTIRVRMYGGDRTVRHNAACDKTDVEDRIDAITGIEAWRTVDERLAVRRTIVRKFGGGCAPRVDCEAKAKALAQNALVLFRASGARLRNTMR